MNLTQLMLNQRPTIEIALVDVHKRTHRIALIKNHPYWRNIWVNSMRSCCAKGYIGIFRMLSSCRVRMVSMPHSWK